VSFEVLDDLVFDERKGRHVSTRCDARMSLRFELQFAICDL